MSAKQTSFNMCYSTDNDSDSEDDVIQQIPDKFKDVDFSVKETSNQQSQLSTNIIKWERHYQQKYINKTTSRGLPRIKPIISTNTWTKIRYIVLEVKYYSLSEIIETLYKDLEQDDLIVVLTHRDETIKRQSSVIGGLSQKVYSLKNQLKFAWSQFYNKHN